jgi:phenylacetate-coenzyme A ligase PaaK-like adenylate-forming protein
MVRTLDADCECGRPFTLIESIEGRTEDILYFPGRPSTTARDALSKVEGRDGAAGEVAIHPNVFHELLETVPASGWQVRQEGDELIVALTGVTDAGACDRLASRLRTALRERGAAIEAVRVEQVDALRRGASGKAPLIAGRASAQALAVL